MWHCSGGQTRRSARSRVGRSSRRSTGPPGRRQHHDGDALVADLLAAGERAGQLPLEPDDVVAAELRPELALDRVEGLAVARPELPGPVGSRERARRGGVPAAGVVGVQGGERLGVAVALSARRAVMKSSHRSPPNNGETAGWTPSTGLLAMQKVESSSPFSLSRWHARSGSPSARPTATSAGPPPPSRTGTRHTAHLTEWPEVVTCDRKGWRPRIATKGGSRLLAPVTPRRFTIELGVRVRVIRPAAARACGGDSRASTPSPDQPRSRRPSRAAPSSEVAAKRIEP